MSTRASTLRALVGIGVLALLGGCGAGATVAPSTAPRAPASGPPAAVVTAAPAATTPTSTGPVATVPPSVTGSPTPVASPNATTTSVTGNATPIDVPPGVLSPSEAADRGVPVVTPSELGRISWTVWLPSDVDHSAIPLSTPHGPVILQGENLIWRLPSGTWQAAPILGTASWPGAALGDDLILTDTPLPARFHWTGSDWIRAGSVEGLEAVRQLRGLAAGPNGLVAVGTTGLASSSDGVRFVRATDAPTCVVSVVARGDGFVALGGPCGTDGSVTLDGIALDSFLQRLEEPIPWTSTDGQTWRRAATASPFGSGSTILRVASHGDRQVAIGLAPPVGGGTGANALLESAVWVSDDGLAWRRLPLLPEAPTSLGASSWGTGFTTIVASDAGWMITAFDSSSMAWTSRDGLAWKPLHGQPAIWGGYLPPIVALGSDAIVVGAIGQEGVAIGTILGP
jgi:hypothetical protein